MILRRSGTSGWGNEIGTQAFLYYLKMRLCGAFKMSSSTVAMIEFLNTSKHFAGVTALNDVSLSIAKGECHGLMGENGAGKSTLGKILAGIHRADAGRVLIDGIAHIFHSPADAQSAGVGMVHQELAFCPELSIAENLNLGQYPRRFGLLSRSRMIDRAHQLLAQIGVHHLDVSAPM